MCCLSRPNWANSHELNNPPRGNYPIREDHLYFRINGRRMETLQTQYRKRWARVKRKGMSRGSSVGVGL